MKFKIEKTLQGGRYLIISKLIETTDDDKKKFEKFGVPTINMKVVDGRLMKIPITTMGQISPFPFFTQEDATEYYDIIKRQLTEIKNRFDTISDVWTSEEEI